MQLANLWIMGCSINAEAGQFKPGQFIGIECQGHLVVCGIVRTQDGPIVGIEFTTTMSQSHAAFLRRNKPALVARLL